MGRGAPEAAGDAANAIEAVEGVAARFGPYARRLHRVIALLAGGPHGLDALIRLSGLSRRTVEELLAAAGPDLILADGAYSLRPEAARRYRERFRLDAIRPATAPAPTDAPEAAARDIERLVANAPAAKDRLDHVAATAQTALRRALWLDEAYDLAGARLLCAGDHDLTSLAACLVSPGLQARVADVDEDLLAYLDAQAERLSLDVRCYYADFRFGLPPELAGWADVAFTDPPYTPAGAALFAARCLEGLRDREFGNVVVSYGAGERHPALALKVQQALSGDLALAFEAILPGFNAYHGAQAIGSRSDLYVCRPTTATWKALARRSRGEGRGGAGGRARGGKAPADAGERIYTRGPQSLEAPPPSMPADLAARVADALSPAAPAGVVGAGLDLGGAVPRAPLATLLGKGLPAEWGGGPVVMDLSDDPGPWLLRALLAANASRVAALIPNNHPDAATEGGQQALRNLIGAKYEVRFRRSFPGPAHAVVETTAAPGGGPGQELRRAVLLRAHGNPLNSWREALIALAQAGGAQLTKNGARAIIDGLASPRQLTAPRLIDMPRHQIARLLALVGESASRLR